MSRISFLQRSIGMVVAGLVSVILLSPAYANYQRDVVTAFPDLPGTTVADRASSELTSHRPWLAPIGHRQPVRTEAPQSESISAWERQQQQSHEEVDRKLIICRGC